MVVLYVLLKWMGRTMKNKNKKRIAQVGWMPFWWGSKFNKRLASKRVRQSKKGNKDKEDIG